MKELQSIENPQVLNDVLENVEWLSRTSANIQHGIEYSESQKGWFSKVIDKIKSLFGYTRLKSSDIQTVAVTPQDVEIIEQLRTQSKDRTEKELNGLQDNTGNVEERLQNLPRDSVAIFQEEGVYKLYEQEGDMIVKRALSFVVGGVRDESSKRIYSTVQDLLQGVHKPLLSREEALLYAKSKELFDLHSVEQGEKEKLLPFIGAEEKAFCFVQKGEDQFTLVQKEGGRTDELEGQLLPNGAIEVQGAKYTNFTALRKALDLGQDLKERVREKCIDSVPSEYVAKSMEEVDTLAEQLLQLKPEGFRANNYPYIFIFDPADSTRVTLCYVQEKEIKKETLTVLSDLHLEGPRRLLSIRGKSKYKNVDEVKRAYYLGKSFAHTSSRLKKKQLLDAIVEEHSGSVQSRNIAEKLRTDLQGGVQSYILKQQKDRNRKNLAGQYELYFLDNNQALKTVKLAQVWKL